MSTPDTPGIFRRVVRRVWRIVRWPLVVLLVLVISLLAINASDDELTPLAQAMLRAPDNPYSDDQNLYVLLAGIDAPAGESMLQRGQRNIAEFSAALAKARFSSDIPVGTGRTPDKEQFRVAVDWKWNALEVSVWDLARDDASHIESLAMQYRELLERLEELRKTSGYVETLRPTAEVPIYPEYPQLRNLYLAETARRIRTGSRSVQVQALQSLKQDLDLHKRMMQGEGNLLSKLQAGAYMQTDLLLLSDVVADTSVPMQTLTAAEAWLKPLPEDTWKIGKTFGAELRFMAEILGPLAKHPDLLLDMEPSFLGRATSRIGSWLYLPNATMNLQAARMQAMRNLADAEPAGLRHRFDTFDAETRSTTYTFPGVLRNPIGKLFISVSTYSYSPYMLRVFDLGARQRAVALAYQIRVQGISPSAIPAFMTAHPELSTHPVGHVPFVWNPETMELRVPSQAEEHPGRRYSMRVARINPDAPAPNR